MDYAESVIHELLLEEVQQNKVINAIKKRHEVSFVYDSGDGDSRGKGERITVQPVAYGTTSAGNPCFRGYQVLGSSESAEKGEGKIPGWRLFILDKVADNTWRDSGKIFEEPPMFNRNGDKTMANVLVIADFEGTSKRYEKGGLKSYNDTRHTQKTSENPSYDFEKQLKNKQIAPSYVMKNIANTDKSEQERQRQWNLANISKNKGNRTSISDMSRQKDFGNNEIQQTVGPQRKGTEAEIQRNDNRPKDYSFARQNGAMYKGEENKEEENLENDES